MFGTYLKLVGWLVLQYCWIHYAMWCATIAEFHAMLCLHYHDILLGFKELTLY